MQSMNPSALLVSETPNGNTQPQKKSYRPDAQPALNANLRPAPDMIAASNVKGIVLIGVCAFVTLSPVDGCSCDFCTDRDRYTLDRFGGSYGIKYGPCEAGQTAFVTSLNVQTTDSTDSFDVTTSRGGDYNGSPTFYPDASTKSASCYNMASNIKVGGPDTLYISFKNRNAWQAAEVRYQIEVACYGRREYTNTNHSSSAIHCCAKIQIAHRCAQRLH